MFNELIVGTVRPFANGTADKNGLEPKIINVLSGKCPNRNVISGTIADNLGLEDNKTYLFQVRETEPNDRYGRQFSYVVTKELDAMEIVKVSKELGSAIIFSVDGDAARPAVVTRNTEIVEEV